MADETHGLAYKRYRRPETTLICIACDDIAADASVRPASKFNGSGLADSAIPRSSWSDAGRPSPPCSGLEAIEPAGYDLEKGERRAYKDAYRLRCSVGRSYSATQEEDALMQA